MHTPPFCLWRTYTRRTRRYVFEALYAHLVAAYKTGDVRAVAGLGQGILQVVGDISKLRLACGIPCHDWLLPGYATPCCCGNRVCGDKPHSHE